MAASSSHGGKGRAGIAGHASRDVYVIGAGFSKGLGFPTIAELLPCLWPKLPAGLRHELAEVIRFNHPQFNVDLPKTFPNIEQLLSEMQANSELFESSRGEVGGFKLDTLESIRERLLVSLSTWFHELKSEAFKVIPDWIKQFADTVRENNAQVVSFNWDLVLDELLFGDDLRKEHYGFGKRLTTTRLLKPHGSLNWYQYKTGRSIKADRMIELYGKGDDRLLAFKPFRAVSSTKRDYMPLIVPPVYAKKFSEPVFQHLWREIVEMLGTASRVTFIGYSLADADFHARFILRCGFYNQEHGVLDFLGDREPFTGRAQVTIVDPSLLGPRRIQAAVGWSATVRRMTAQEWIERFLH